MNELSVWPQWQSRSLDVETPVPVVDLDVVERNIRRLQQACNAAGLMNRPHVKTHKSIAMAELQMKAGAVGLTCQKLGEAEVMADAGFDNLLISYNIMGDSKLARLARLASRVSLTVSCDSLATAEGLSHVMAAADTPLPVLVECDNGRGRCGLPYPEQVVELARQIDTMPGLTFEGLLTYPPDGAIENVKTYLSAVRQGCAEHGLDIRTISTGGTPNIPHMGKAGETEYRSGTSIYNDRMMMVAGVAGPRDCALMIHSTVVSSPTADRVILDAGSKTLSSDLGGLADYGLLVDYPEARIYQLAEEHGFVDVSLCSRPPLLGEVVRILPNHVCPVSNLFDRIALTRSGVEAGWLMIDARGRVS